MKGRRNQKLTIDDTVGTPDAIAPASFSAVARVLDFTGTGTAAEIIAANLRLMSVIADGRMGALLSHCPWLALQLCQQLPMSMGQLVERR